MKKKIGIFLLLLVLLVICFGAGYYVGNKYDFKITSKEFKKEKEEKKVPESKKVDKKTYILSGGFNISYDNDKIYGCSLKDGSLKGDCYNDKLKNKKIISLVEGPGSTASTVYVLTSDKEIYSVTYLGGDEENESSVEMIYKDSKIENIGSFVFEDDCHFGAILVVKKENKEYVLESSYVNDNEDKWEIRDLDKVLNDDFHVSSISSCARPLEFDYKLAQTSISYTDKVFIYDQKAEESKVVKDEKGKDIIASYVVYTIDEDNKETLYIISKDNKLYKLNEVSYRIASIGEVDNLLYTPGVYDENDSEKSEPAVLEFNVENQKYSFTELE